MMMGGRPAFPSITNHFTQRDKKLFTMIKTEREKERERERERETGKEGLVEKYCLMESAHIMEYIKLDIS